MTGGPWLVVGIGVIVVVLASVMLMFAPALADLRGRDRSRSRTAEPPPPGVRRPTSYAGSLIKGFGYMFGSRRRPRRRMDSVGLRFDRAMARIDTVDPYDAQRRIGEAMVVAGLVDEADLPEEETELPDDAELTGVATDEPPDEPRGSSHE
jgi:hypothetical protein